MVGIGIRIIFIWAMTYVGIAGVVASRVEWRFGIFAVDFRWKSS